MLTKHSEGLSAMKYLKTRFGSFSGGIAMKTCFSALARALLAVVVAGAAGRDQAETVVTNLANAPFSVDAAPRNAAAQSFTTGGLAEDLQSVTLKLLGGAGSIDVSVFSNNAGLPGTSLLHLGTLTPAGVGFADYTLIAPSGFTLAANTTYWVEGNYIGSPDWAYTNDQTFSGSGKLGNFTNSSDGGATWNGPYSDAPYQFQVDAGPAAVPEPATLVLALSGIALGGLDFARRGRATA